MKNTYKVNREAVEKIAEKVYENGSTVINRNDLEEMFPALKESEDERIRENIIATIHLYYGEPLEDEAEEMIAWLEEQGEHAKFCDSIQVGDKVTRNRDGVLVNLSQLKRVAKPAKNKGEHDMGISEATKQELEDNLNKALEKETPESCNKFLDGLKSADKVEPKFKVGDLVVIDGEALHVKEVTEDGYLTDEGGLIPFRNEKEAHLWTIQDAKHGDVLRIRNLTFIFQEITNNNVCHKDAAVAYCSYEDYNDGFGVCGPDCITDLEIITPATKEQRDLLFQKMKETGYEWDAEKKELKKIEFNPDDLIEESYQQQADDLIGMVTEKSAEWSKKDEHGFENCLYAIKETFKGVDNPHRVGTINWLKSLKDRVQVQSQWKPSEVQINALAKNVEYVNVSCTQPILKGLLEDLKKLREE